MTRALAVTQAATMCAKKQGIVLGKAPTLDAINSICLEIDEIGLLVEHMDVLKLEGLTLWRVIVLLIVPSIRT